MQIYILGDIFLFVETFNFVYFMGRTIYELKVPTKYLFTWVISNIIHKIKCHEHVHRCQTTKFSAHEIKLFHSSTIYHVLLSLMLVFHCACICCRDPVWPGGNHTAPVRPGTRAPAQWGGHSPDPERQTRHHRPWLTLVPVYWRHWWKNHEGGVCWLIIICIYIYIV